MRRLTALAALVLAAPALAADLRAEVDRRARDVEQKVITLRRDFHQHPELSNRETRTAQVVAEALRKLGLTVRAGVAKTGVVGILEGGRPGPTVALRADMDALPVTEQVDVPFASKVRTTFNGQDVGVMHACGHDAHTAMLLGTAEVLAGMREQLAGRVVFLFQPAEEGAPAGEEGGAALMVKEGVLERPRPDAVFGLHVGVTGQEAGVLSVRPGGMMAAADNLRIVVKGKQTHGAKPWAGVDPVVVSAQIVTALQTIVSRQVDVTHAPAVVTVGSIHGGVRENIVPDRVELLGTVRTFDPAMRKDIHARIARTAKLVAESAGASAEVTLLPQTPVTANDERLLARMGPTLERVAGKGRVRVAPAVTGAEDFAFYGEKVPAMYFFLGVAPKGTPPEKAAPNHSPHFFVDESALATGTRALAHLAVDFLTGGR